jgi:hypothetical protein
MANEIKPEVKDMAAPATGRMVSHIWGQGGKNYAATITAVALNQTAQIIKPVTKTDSLKQTRGSFTPVYEENRNQKDAPIVPRPDHLFKDKMMVQKAIMENEQKQKLLAELKSMGVAPDPKLKLEEILELRNNLVNKRVPSGPKP